MLTFNLIQKKQNQSFVFSELNVNIPNLLNVVFICIQKIPYMKYV